MRPPRTGKTSLARLIAGLVYDDFMELTAPVTEKALVKAITGFHGVLFIHEIHALGPKMQELLLPVLEFGEVRRPNGDIIDNRWLTIVAATTECHQVLPALYRRFSYAPQYEPYTPAQCSAIAQAMGRKIGLELDASVYDAIGQAAGGKAHAVGRMMLAARDIAAVYEGSPTIGEILDLCGTAGDGLTDSHIEYCGRCTSWAALPVRTESPP